MTWGMVILACISVGVILAILIEILCGDFDLKMMLAMISVGAVAGLIAGFALFVVVTVARALWRMPVF